MPESALNEWRCDVSEDCPGYVELSFIEVTDEGVHEYLAYFTPQDAMELSDALRHKAVEVL